MTYGRGGSGAPVIFEVVQGTRLAGGNWPASGAPQATSVITTAIVAVKVLIFIAGDCTNGQRRYAAGRLAMRRVSSMQRLLVSTSHESDFHAIARRLRGASAIWSSGSRAREPAVDLYDAVIVLRPGADTPADLARYMQTGKDILLAEPWKVEPQVRGRLLSVAAAKGVRLWLVNPDRYLPSRRAIQQELAAGKLGRPGLLRI